MKKLALAAALSVAASTAFAGAHAKGEVMMEKPVIVEVTESTSTSAGIIVPLVLLALVVAAASSSH